MKRKTLFNLLKALGLMLALSCTIVIAYRAQAQEPGPQGGGSIRGTPLSTAFTYQGRLTDTAGDPIAGPCGLRFTLYESAAGADQVGAPQTKPDVTLDEGYFTVELDFGAAVFTGEGRFLKIEVDCGSGYTALSPRVDLTPAPYAFHAVSTGALHGHQVSDSAPSAGDVLAWDGNSWTPTGGGTGAAWSLNGNAGTDPNTNFLGTTDNVSLTLAVNGTAALRLEPDALSPNLIGGHSGNNVTAGVYGATIGGGGLSGIQNQVTDTFGTVGGGFGNTAGSEATVGGGQRNAASGSYATVGGGYRNTAGERGATVSGGLENTAGYNATVGGGQSNTASFSYATVGGGNENTASGYYATVGGGHWNTASGRGAVVPGGLDAKASLDGQWAYAGEGNFSDQGDAQASLYVMRAQTDSSGVWEDLYLNGGVLFEAFLTLPPTRTLTYDILVVGRSNAGESAGYYCWGVIENVGGTTTVLGGGPCMELGQDDSNWDAQVVADDTHDALAVQVQGNGETIRWVATVRTAEVAW